MNRSRSISTRSIASRPHARGGEPQRARAGYEEALALARQLGDQQAIAQELHSLGARDLSEGHIASARARLGEALAIATAISDAKWTAESEWWLAELERLHGSCDAACAGFTRALAIYERLNSPDAEEPRTMLKELGCMS